MKDIKRQYWNPGRSGRTTYCSGCPFLVESTNHCSLGYEVRQKKVSDIWVPASVTCELNNVTWSTTTESKPDVEQKTG